MDHPSRQNSRLIIDLGAIRANYRQLLDIAAPARCAAVVKADAYGLGLVPVARALAREGCDEFYVATIDEAVTLRQALPDPTIYVFHGLTGLEPADFTEHRLVPVLVNPDDVNRWAEYADAVGPQACVLHVDTGMNRLGLTEAETRRLADDTAVLNRLDVALVMSHLACADTPENPMNRRQKDLFNDLRTLLPPVPASLASTAGVHMGPQYDLHQVRPGIGLYGGNPFSDRPNPHTQVVELKARILQVRQIDTGQAVGYGATHAARRPSRIASVAVGYADGYLRCLGNRGFGYVDDIKVPVVGRISMDLLTLDVTDCPETLVHPGASIRLIGQGCTVDDVAQAAGTIPNEVLTSLGSRYVRDYVGEDR